MSDGASAIYFVKNKFPTLNCKFIRIAKTQTGKWLLSSTTLNGSSKKSRRSNFSYMGIINVYSGKNLLVIPYNIIFCFLKYHLIGHPKVNELDSDIGFY